MRAPLLLIALALSACNAQSKDTGEDTKRQSAEWLYQSFLKQGDTPAVAHARVQQVLADMEQNHERFGNAADKRQSEVDQVKAGACKNDPALSYC